jgi:hypothetical protein
MPASTKDSKTSTGKGTRWLWSIPCLVAVLLILNHHYQWYKWPWVELTPPPKKEMGAKPAKRPLRAPAPESSSTPAKVAEKHTVKEEITTPIIDYEKIKDKSDKGLKELIQERKKEFGVNESVDMVVKSGENIRVGEEVVPLDRILAEIEAQKKGQQTPPAATTSQSATEFPTAPQLAKPDSELTVTPTRETRQPMPARPGAAPQLAKTDSERTVTQTGKTRQPMPARPGKEPLSYYGIYVVRPGDNLWNIHFAFLREYFGSRGIQIPPDSDEPVGTRSSGIGRILKYAETMVHIFNLKTGKLSMNLNLLEPKEKIVVFNLSALDKSLAPLTYGQIDIIRFDGRDLILPGHPSFSADSRLQEPRETRP